MSGGTIYRNRAVEKVAARYEQTFNRPPPPGFLAQFTFHDKFKKGGRGSINIRRLDDLGKPKICYHPAIESGFVKKGKSKRFIDAGCATGEDARWLLKHGYGKVVAMDKDQGAIDLGFAFYGDKDSNHPFMVADVTQIKPTKLRYDYIHSGSLFHNMGSIEEVNAFVKASRGALKDKGGFFGQTLGSNNSFADFIPLCLSEEQIRTAIKQYYDIKDFQVRPLGKNDIRFRAYYTAVPKPK